MEYKRLKPFEISSEIQTEADAREWFWRCRFSGKDFVCPRCACERYYRLETRPEVLTCKGCLRQIRLRAGTILENSKLPLLIWVRALELAMQGKRGISASEVQRVLAMTRYETAWGMMQKIREALRQRDEPYRLSGLVELDGAAFGKRSSGHQETVLVAVQEKDWVDDHGRPKHAAGFAKVLVAPESTICAQQFSDRYIVPGTMVNTDGDPSYQKLSGVQHDYRVMQGDPQELDRWLPWVHKFISNARIWMLGTHHGVAMKNLGRYLAEYTYRFNRRHDPTSLFHRALTACALAAPVTFEVLLHRQV